MRRGFREGLPIAVLRARILLLNAAEAPHCLALFVALQLLVRLLAMIRWSWQFRRGIRFGTKIWRIEIVFSGNPDQREKGIPARIGEGRPPRAAPTQYRRSGRQANPTRSIPPTNAQGRW